MKYKIVSTIVILAILAFVMFLKMSEHADSVDSNGNPIEQVNSDQR